MSSPSIPLCLINVIVRKIHVSINSVLIPGHESVLNLKLCATSLNIHLEYGGLGKACDEYGDYQVETYVIIKTLRDQYVEDNLLTLGNNCWHRLLLEMMV